MRSGVWRWVALAAGAAAVLAAAELALRLRYRLLYSPPTAGPSDALTIVALGDSITAGAPGGREDAWPALLEDQLRVHAPSYRWRVVNAGVSGDTALRGYGRFDRDVAAAGPDAVLIAFGLNDCALGRHGMDLWLEGRVPVGLERSYLWQALAARIERLGTRFAWSGAPAVEQEPQPYSRTSPEGFSAALDALLSRCRVVGAQPVLVTMIPLGEVETDGVRLRRPSYEEYNARIRAAAATAHAPLVSLAARAPATAYEPDGFHLNAEGQAWVAQQVFDQLAAAGFWARMTGASR